MTTRYTIRQFAQKKFAEKGKKLIIPAKYVNERFSEYAILITSEDDFTECCNRLKGKSIEEVLPKLIAITRNIMKYSDKELNEHYEANNQAFKDWGDDVILFYIHRAAMDDHWAEKNPIRMMWD